MPLWNTIILKDLRLSKPRKMRLMRSAVSFILEYLLGHKNRMIGYFESVDKAEYYLQHYCLLESRGEDWDKDLHHFRIEKLSLNTELVTGLGYWVYKKDGSLFQHYPGITAPFLEVSSGDLKFQKKEIVEVLSKGRLELAIIVTTPPPPAYVERLKEYSKTYLKGESPFNLDISDYIYNTISYQRGVSPENIVEKRSQHYYDHTSFLDIFPAPESISTEQQLVLESLYEYYHQTMGEHKE